MVPEQWLSFIQERWFVIIAAAVALLLIINLVKTVVKWVLVVAIVAAVLVYGANYKDELTAMSDQVLAEAKEQALQAIVGQAFNATYEANGDGTFVVYTDSVRVEGKEGDNEVTLFWKGVKIGTFPLDNAIKAFIQEAKDSGSR
ncbi:hypothetical protein [Paenibacillus thermotolerans]|uniref:hypothetical protein n=1 Tax=Paenibacillus thermotolerans TaxID=3027807 RepID=UPI002368ADF7|nr:MULTISPECIES: hypothetical protein [unclassified Paenibacillus]